MMAVRIALLVAVVFAPLSALGAQPTDDELKVLAKATEKATATHLTATRKNLANSKRRPPPQLVVDNMRSPIVNVTRFISVANPPTAPEAHTASDGGGVASALSATASGVLASPVVPRWLGRRLTEVNLNSGPIAKYFQHIASENMPQVRKYSLAADQIANRLGLGNHLLDELLLDFYLD